MARIKNNTELRNDLLDLYNDCRNGNADENQVQYRAKIADKILRSAAAQMAYNKYQGNSNKIDFFEQ